MKKSCDNCEYQFTNCFDDKICLKNRKNPNICPHYTPKHKDKVFNTEVKVKCLHTVDYELHVKTKKQLKSKGWEILNEQVSYPNCYLSMYKPSLKSFTLFKG